MPDGKMKMPDGPPYLDGNLLPLRFSNILRLRLVPTSWSRREIRSPLAIGISIGILSSIRRHFWLVLHRDVFLFSGFGPNVFIVGFSQPLIAFSEQRLG